MATEPLSQNDFDALLAEQGLVIPAEDRQAALEAAYKLRQAADRVTAAAAEKPAGADHD